MKRRRTNFLYVAVLAVSGTSVISGCTADVRDGLGPRVPIPSVKGLVMRGEEEANGLKVELRDLVEDVAVSSTATDDDGEFVFSDVGSGLWEIKIHGDESKDFDSVTLEFSKPSESCLVTLPSLDVLSYGAAPVEPEDGATLDAPAPGSPVVFRWIPPSRAFKAARVQVYDEEGGPVWFSEKMITDEWRWDGFGNTGDYEGRSVGPGVFRWRVKVELADSLDARLDKLRMVIQ